MSMIYSHVSDRMIDTDACEVFELNNGDVVAMDDDANLLCALEMGLTTKEELMDNAGFTEEDFS